MQIIITTVSNGAMIAVQISQAHPQVVMVSKSDKETVEKVQEALALGGSVADTPLGAGGTSQPPPQGH